MSLADDDADWEAAEAEELTTSGTSTFAAPIGAGLPPVGGVPQTTGGMPRPGGPPQQIDPKLVKKWNIIYPCYLNPRKTVNQGRRLPLSQLVGCEDPWPQEIAECLGKLGFKIIVLETKTHPQDWLVRARVRVELHDDKGVPTVPAYASKQAVLKAVAQLLPSSPFRINRLQQMARQQELFRQQQAAAAAQAATQKATTPKKEEAKALTAGPEKKATKKRK